MALPMKMPQSQPDKRSGTPAAVAANALPPIFESVEKPEPRTRNVCKPGDVIRGRYEIAELIGAGGMSTVYRALDHRRVRARSKDPHVAIKVVSAASDSQADLIELMYREARRLFELSHPNIVQVYDWDAEDNTHYIVMEHLSGRTLAKVFQESGKPIGYQAARDYLAPVCEAVQFLHERGIVHCDLKPGNIFVTDSGEVKLLDFGFSHKFDEITDAEDDPTVYYLDRINAVTPIFASKDMLIGNPPIPSDDVFSLAVIAYMLTAGRHPFGRKTVVEADEQGHELERPSGLPNRPWQVLRDGLALDRTDRIQSVSTFYDGFFSRGPWHTLFGLLQR